MRATIVTANLAAGTNILTLTTPPRPASTYLLLLWTYVSLASTTTIEVTFRVGGSAAAVDNPLLASETAQSQVFIPCRPVPASALNVAAQLVVTVGDTGVVRFAWSDSEGNH